MTYKFKSILANHKFIKNSIKKILRVKYFVLIYCKLVQQANLKTFHGGLLKEGPAANFVKNETANVQTPIDKLG